MHGASLSLQKLCLWYCYDMTLYWKARIKWMRRNWRILTNVVPGLHFRLLFSLYFLMKTKHRKPLILFSYIICLLVNNSKSITTLLIFCCSKACDRKSTWSCTWFTWQSNCPLSFNSICITSISQDWRTWTMCKTQLLVTVTGSFVITVHPISYY